MKRRYQESRDVNRRIAQYPVTDPSVDLQYQETIDAARDAPSGADIVSECLEIAKTLCRKNAAYGDSALSPVRVFSRANAEEQILVRLDDKLSRLSRGSDDGEDTVSDLIGYLVLLRIARKRRAQQEK